jgi:hypothetical protein
MATACLTAVAAPAFAQVPPHPRAGQAIADLRSARDILSRLGQYGVSAPDSRAIYLIDKAVAASRRIVQYDRYLMHAHEGWTVDAAASTRSPHENARIMMRAALRDLDQPEYDPTAQPYVQEARNEVREAIDIIRNEQEH